MVRRHCIPHCGTASHIAWQSVGTDSRIATRAVLSKQLTTARWAALCYEGSTVRDIQCLPVPTVSLDCAGHGLTCAVKRLGASQRQATLHCADTVRFGPCKMNPGLDVGPGPRWTRHIKRIFACVPGSYTHAFPIFDRGPPFSIRSLQPDSIELDVVRDRKFEP